MRTVNFRDDIVYGIAALLGIDPENDLNKDHVAAWTRFVNTRLRYGWEFWPWPEFTLTEERAMRTIWNSARHFQSGDELFYIPDMSYYRAIALPPAGTLPTNTTYFEPLMLNEFYVAYHQSGQRDIGEVLGIYTGNPRLNCGSYMNALSYRPGEKGIDLVPYGSGPTVWVTYRRPPSVMTWKAWDPAVAYKEKALVYWSGTGSCYRCTIPNTNIEPTNASYWALVPAPYLLAEWVKYGAAADAADDANNTAFLNAEAESYLYREVDKLAEQGQKYHYRKGNCCGYLSFAPMGAPWYLSPPWTSTEVTTLTDADVDSGSSITTTEDEAMTTEGGVIDLVNGQDYIDVVFIAPHASYSFDELTVTNNVDDPPLALYVTVISFQDENGFRAMLNAPPDSTHYKLNWRIGF